MLYGIGVSTMGQRCTRTTMRREVIQQLLLRQRVSTIPITTDGYPFL